MTPSGGPSLAADLRKNAWKAPSDGLFYAHRITEPGYRRLSSKRFPRSTGQGLIPAGSICGCGCTTSGRLHQERSCEASSLLGGYCRAVFLVLLPISYGGRQGCYISAIPFFRRILYRWFTEPNRGAFIKECPYSRSSSSVSADGGYQPADLAGGCIATTESQCVHVGVFQWKAN